MEYSFKDALTGTRIECGDSVVLIPVVNMKESRVQANFEKRRRFIPIAFPLNGKLLSYTCFSIENSIEKKLFFNLISKINQGKNITWEHIHNLYQKQTRIPELNNSTMGYVVFHKSTWDFIQKNQKESEDFIKVKEKLLNQMLAFDENTVKRKMGNVIRSLNFDNDMDSFSLNYGDNIIHDALLEVITEKTLENKKEIIDYIESNEFRLKFRKIAELKTMFDIFMTHDKSFDVSSICHTKDENNSLEILAIAQREEKIRKKIEDGIYSDKVIDKCNNKRDKDLSVLTDIMNEPYSVKISYKI